MLGRWPDAARSAPWSRSLDWPIGDPTLAAITEEAERHMAAAQAALQHGDEPDARNLGLIQGLALYVLYYRSEAAFFALITADAPAERVEFYESFARDFAELFSNVPPPSWARDPARVFALFFQTRRAFHFVFHQILGTSQATSQLRETVWESLFTHDPWRYLAHLQGRMHEASTLILGPTGTGKELVASAIGLSSFIPFDASRRQFTRSFRTAFHPLHLAAMSTQLIESELFGHKKGAFTGATARKPGRFELANVDALEGLLEGRFSRQYLRHLLLAEARALAERGAGRVTIPLYGQKGSLNVSAAFAILIYAWRQAWRQADTKDR